MRLPRLSFTQAPSTSAGRRNDEKIFGDKQMQRGHDVSHDSQRGQIGLVVLLAMVVMLTIGVAVSRRSVTQLVTTRQEAESSRVFEAAETGVEAALELISQGGVTADVSGTVTIGTQEVNYNIEPQNSVSRQMQAGEVLEVRLDGSDVDINIGLSDSGTCSESGSNLKPALIATFFDNSGGIVRMTYDPCDASERGDNNFDRTALSNINVINFVLARIRLVYGSGEVSVSGTLPPQEYRVRSSATADDGETRSVETNQGLPQRPALFDYVLYSGGNI